MTTTTCVQVKLELGQRATVREHITDDGFTHDWTVYVRGPESCNIHHFVEKVIFHLHNDFPKPKRVVKEAPYEVSESGYGGFIIHIEVFFKQKDDPKKVEFDYDLVLNTHGSVNTFRTEKLTFQNPTDEFRKKLLKAGGVGIVQPESGSLLPLTHYSQRPSTPNLNSTSSSSSAAAHSKDRKLAIKAPKSSTSSSSSAALTASNSSSLLKDTSHSINKDIKNSSAAPPAVKQTFVDLFGQPIKANKNSSDPLKIKNSQSKKSLSSNQQSRSSSIGKDIGGSGGRNSSEHSLNNNLNVKDPKSQAKEKIFSKRPVSPPTADSPQPGHKKRKRSSTSSPSSSSYGSSRSKGVKEIDQKSADKKASQVKVKSEKKEKHKSSVRVESGSIGSSKSDAKSGKELSTKPVKRLKQEKVIASSPSLSTNSSVGSTSELNSRSRDNFTPPQPRTGYEADVYGGGGGNGEEESRSSTSSFSSVHQSKGNGPLGALMAELDDEQDDVLSPLSSDGSPPRGTFIKQEPLQPPPPSHNRSSPDIKSNESKHERVKVKIKEEKVKESKSKKSSEQSGKKSSSGKDNSGYAAGKPIRIGISEEYIGELQDLQRRIMLLKDRKHLQEIVNVIEETGLYQVTSTTFDFDLCSLDRETVKKLQNCLAVIA